MRALVCPRVCVHGGQFTFGHYYSFAVEGCVRVCACVCVCVHSGQFTFGHYYSFAVEGCVWE